MLARSRRLFYLHPNGDHLGNGAKQVALLYVGTKKWYAVVTKPFKSTVYYFSSFMKGYYQYQYCFGVIGLL